MSIMNMFVNSFLGFTAGAAAGIIFFLGLWLTVKQSVSKKSGKSLFVISFVIRFLLVAVFFYLSYSFGSAVSLIAGLTGFLTARIVVTKHVKQASRKEETGV
ncbi:MAG: ATP synthase subunit I [Spirochaetales bacterium]|nr:ATP synthase subunit I [Spirochaetales bacterium]